jgi:hypothetical protein
MNGGPPFNNNYPPPGGYAPPAGGFGAPTNQPQYGQAPYGATPGYGPTPGYAPMPNFGAPAYGGYGGHGAPEPALTSGSPSLRWWILGTYLGMMVPSVIGGAIQGASQGNDTMMMIGSIISLLTWPIFIGYFVLVLVWIYKSWEMLPPALRMTGSGTFVSPGQAVGYLFIPFYNLYWYFVVSVGLCHAYNRVLAGYNSPKRASTGLATAAAVVQVIPYINFVVAPILWLVFMFNVDGAKREYAQISMNVANQQLR